MTRTYADNFGLQWANFRATQYDSHTGTTRTADRLWRTTKWNPAELAGRTVLEAGCGAGRFTEILLGAGAKVVAFDMSEAALVAFAQNRDKGELRMFRGDILAPPLKPRSFDFVFCHGVVQHTPDPAAAIRTLFDLVAPGGRLSLDVYPKLDGPSPWSTPKYFWRRWSVKLRPETLLKIVRFYVPLWLPFDTAIRHIPYVGNWILAQLRIPCWNYIDLPWAQRREWAVLDTFDALSPRYDLPMREAELRAAVDLPEACEIDVFAGGNGFVANLRRKA
jgi:SAM-dependent methyltransferase